MAKTDTHEPAAVWVATSELTPWAANPRDNAKAIAEVAKSIRRFGWGAPIVANKRDGEIIAGHTRFAAAQKLKLDRVPVRWLDLDPADAHALALADNKVGEIATWDDATLGQVLRDLRDADATLLADTGFSDEELARLLGEVAPTVLEPEDEPAEVDERGPVHSVLGEVYELGPHRLRCGDSTSVDAVDVLMAGEKAEAIVTDPPYGIGIDGQKASVSKNPKHNRKAHEFRGWDAERPDPGVFELVVALNVPTVIWGGNYFADLLPPTRGWIYWSKGQDGLTMSDGELAWTTSDKPLRCVTVNRGALRGSEHPTQKPIEVIAFSLDHIEAGRVVLDLFGGSGTTLIACAQSNRIARLMELDPRYCDVIRRRWTRFAKANNLDAGSGALDAA